MSEELVEARVIMPNITITQPGGKDDLRPELGDVIKVRPDQVTGGLNGKVRLLSDEPKGSAPILTVDSARAYLTKAGLAVLDPSSKEDEEAAATWLRAKGYTVTKKTGKSKRKG